MVSIENADVTFAHCILRNSASDAINISPGLRSATQLAGLVPLPAVQVSWSSLSNISGYAIHNGLAQAVLAAFNWWGAAVAQPPAITPVARAVH